MLKDRDAEPFLTKDCGLKRNEARTLIQSGGSGLWRLKKMIDRPGQPVILLPSTGKTRLSDVDHSEDVAAESTRSETPHKQTTEIAQDSADRINTGPRNSDSCRPASDVGILRRTRFSPSDSDRSKVVLEPSLAEHVDGETAADVDVDELQDMDL